MKIDEKSEVLVVSQIPINGKLNKNFFKAEYMNKIDFRKKTYYIFVDYGQENIMSNYADLTKVGLKGIESDRAYNTVFSYT